MYSLSLEVFISLFATKKKVIETKKKLPQKPRCESTERSGAWGVGGEQGMAITGSDEGDGAHYWQLCPL